ncbi:MAG: hypothetical protein R3B06_00935 [Kofleriaceae bacterium]
MAAASTAPSGISAAVVVDGHEPYAMFEATQVTPTGARLSGPLLLEIGEAFTVRLTRGDTVVELPTTVVQVERQAHGDSTLVVTFAAADGARVAPLCA